MNDPDTTWGLIVPFVVVESKGGPYNDQAFTAGYEMGIADMRCRIGNEAGANDLRFPIVRTDCLPQLDLIAMHHGYTMHVHPADDTLPEWSACTLRSQHAGTGDG